MTLTLKAENAIVDKSSSHYVFDLTVQQIPSSVGALAAASTSDFAVVILLYSNLSKVGSISAHDSVVSDLQFSRRDPFLLFSSSLDGTLRCWDLRTDCSAAALTLRGSEKNKFTSVGLSGDGTLLAAGTELEQGENEKEAYVVFWDVRARTCVGAYSESHTDDVTQVKFHPTQHHLLASGSTDGLVCVYDLKESSEDDSLFSTLNTESSVARIGWFSSSNLYSTTHLESVHAWEAMESDPIFSSKSLVDAEIPSSGDAAAQLDYVADCVWHPELEEMWCLAGRKSSGEAALVKIGKDGFSPDSRTRLPSVHTDTIRSCAVDWRQRNLITAGEDGRVCLWDLNSWPENESEEGMET